MDTVHTPAPDNSSGQLGPGDICRTRTLDNSSGSKPFAGKPAVASSLGNVPSFADTQQKWEDPAPYGGTPNAETPHAQQNVLKEPSLVFVRSVTQSPALVAQKLNTGDDGTPRLELTPGTQAEVEIVGANDDRRAVAVNVARPKGKKLHFVEPTLVEGRQLGKGIGYLKIAMFPDMVGVKVANEISTAVTKLGPVESLIIDLRGNTGGGLGALRVMTAA